MIRVLLLAAAALLFGTGCISSQVGIGVAVVKPYGGSVEVRPQLRYGIDPAQLVAGQMKRGVDGSAGLVTEIRHPFSDDLELKSSVYLQATKVLSVEDFQNNSVKRTNVSAAARFSWDREGPVRVGVEPMVWTEISQFSRENKDDSSGSTHTFGEIGAGLYVAGVIDSKAFGISAGLLTRVPFGIIVPGQM